MLACVCGPRRPLPCIPTHHHTCMGLDGGRGVMGATVASLPVQAFYANTLQHIRQQKAKGGEAGARYEALSV